MTCTAVARPPLRGCAKSGGTQVHHVGVAEYLIRAADGESSVVFERERMSEVLTPWGFGDQQVPGWGDFRVWLGTAEVAFSAEPPGCQVVIEGEFDEARADELVQAVASQIQEAKGSETTWVRIG